MQRQSKGLALHLQARELCFFEAVVGDATGLVTVRLNSEEIKAAWRLATTFAPFHAMNFRGTGLSRRCRGDQERCRQDDEGSFINPQLVALIPARGTCYVVVPLQPFWCSGKPKMFSACMPATGTGSTPNGTKTVKEKHGCSGCLVLHSAIGAAVVT